MKSFSQLARYAAVAVIACIASSAFAQTVPVVTAKRDIAANTVLEANDLEIVQWDIQKTPGKSFAEIESVIGQTVINKVFANSPILKTNLVQLPAEEPASSGEDRIVAIPVAISTRYKVGELVRLVHLNERDQRQVIADQLKVFHIGEPDMIKDEDGKQIFIRFVSVLAPLEVAEKITNSINDRGGSHVLEKLNPEPVENTTSTNTNNNTGRQPAPNNNSVNREPTLPLNAKTYSDQLREMARMLETQAAELENQAKYEQADLIRDACQKLREAARVR